MPYNLDVVNAISRVLDTLRRESKKVPLEHQDALIEALIRAVPDVVKASRPPQFPNVELPQE